MQSGRWVQPSRAVRPSRILQPFTTRCLGASEDSLLAQLSSRASVASAVAESKLRKYAPGEAMRAEAQLQANVLLAAPQPPELLHKAAAAAPAAAPAAATTPPAAPAPTAPDLSAFDDATPLKPAPPKPRRPDGRRPLMGIAFQRRGAAGGGGEGRLGYKSLPASAPPHSPRPPPPPLPPMCLRLAETAKSALGNLLGDDRPLRPSLASRSASLTDEAMVKMLMRADTHVDLEITTPVGLRPSFTWSQVFASISVSIGSMIVGFSSAYTSPALVSMREPNSTLSITLQQESWIGSLMPLSALAGGMAGGLLIEWMGRRTTILATALPFIVSWLLIGLAVNVPMIYAGRIISGFCVGVTSLSLPVYMGETIQPEVRGMLGLISTTLGNIGILVCFLAGKYLDWSNLAFFGAMIPVPFLIFSFFIPETPRWYISKDKHPEAKAALTWLRGGKGVDVSTELAEIEKNHRDAVKNAPTSMGELFTKGNLKPIFISISLMFFQQLSGINAVIFYTVKIFQDAGSSIDENLSTIVVGIVNLGSTFLATVLIDRLGRRVLLGASSVAMALSLTVLGTFFYLRLIEVDVSACGWVPLFSFVVFVIGFSLGYGPIPWLMLGEIFPAKIRGLAASLATAFNWACTFIVTKTFNDLVDALGTHGVFWMFGAVCFASLFFVIFCVPETQGKTLEDIENNFKGKVRRRMSSITNIKPMPMGV